MRTWRINCRAWLLIAISAFVAVTLHAESAPSNKLHWAFAPIQAPNAPPGPNSIDRFVLNRLRTAGLEPNSPASRRILIRRLNFDLIGLPPTPEEVAAFEADKSPNAYEKLVDRLLASPHYGERWGRHWLDLARYADSDGMESDHDRPKAYHYRDFVIRALNDDMPFNTFARWQIAGDEYEPDNPEAISATGFLAAARHTRLDGLMEEEKIREKYNELDDILATTGQTFLALTFGCARCHDHKYDLIPTRDYYRMLAVFSSMDRCDVPLVKHTDPAVASMRDWRTKLAAARNAKDDRAAKSLEANKPAIPCVFAVAEDSSQPHESWLLDRGDFRRKKEPVEPGFLSILCGKPVNTYLTEAKKAGIRTDTTYQRRAFADWIADTENGAGALLARVEVNRIWQGHFGEGLVRTVNDFGKRCDPPTHPELLEWLADRLVKGGWKVKPIHRMIVLSDAYRESAAFDFRKAKIDPENRLLWRHRSRRIESEVFRDSLLAVAGSLKPDLFGPAFKPPIAAEAMLARNVQDPYPGNLKDTLETHRRTIYMYHKRVVPYPLTQAFDSPDASACTGKRNVTTVAPQALAILNEPFVRSRAAEFARRLKAEAGNDIAAQVKLAYRLALGRLPSPAEQYSSEAFLARQYAAHAIRSKDGELLAMTDFAQVIFGLNEFMYVD